MYANVNIQMRLDIRYHTYSIASAFPVFPFSYFSLPYANSWDFKCSAETSFNSWNGEKYFTASVHVEVLVT